MTKLAPEWVRTSDPVIRSPARYRWTTAPAQSRSRRKCKKKSFRNAAVGNELYVLMTCANPQVLEIRERF